MTNLKNFELKKYVQNFKVLPISLIYSFDDPNDQLDTLNKLILKRINEHAPLMKSKFRGPTAPWMKDFEINKLQKERATGVMRLIASIHLNHGKNSEQLGTKSKTLSTRQVSTKKYFNGKTKMTYGNLYIAYLVSIQKH